MLIRMEFEEHFSSKNFNCFDWRKSTPCPSSTSAVYLIVCSVCMVGTAVAVSDSETGFSLAVVADLAIVFVKLFMK